MHEIEAMPIPEPAMWLMMGVGALLTAFVKLRAGEQL
jgi:hypothetical protein